ncbi:MAG: outer membrane beta-barrel protein [Bacteroidales bacterium]
MKTKELMLCALLALLSMTSYAKDGEHRFGFEINGGTSFSTRKLAGANLNTGVGLEGTFHFRILKHTGLYAGWGWNKFSAEESFAGADMDFEETGYVFGLQFRHSVAKSPVSFFVRAGGLYNHIEIEDEEGDIIADSGHGLGWQAAAGICLPLGGNWCIAPGIKYNSLKRDVTIENVTTELKHKYISLRVGIIWKF